MELQSVMAALGRFGTGLFQHARLITLASAQPGGLPEALMAERFAGREAVGELYAFEVDALSTSTDLDLDTFIGEELTITLLQPDDARRAWHGICTRAEWLGADGGVARYRLRLEPALALLRLRRDSYIFQDKTALDIAAELFADYPQLRFEFDVTQELATRPVCTQYRESDYDFFVRLMASEGLSWRFEHDGADEGGDGQARHKLVIFDSRAISPDTPGNPVIRFHGVRASDSDDAIDGFGARRQVAASAVSISSWDPEQVFAPAAEQQSMLDAGEIPLLAVFDGSGERIASADAELHSQLMLQALELDNKLFTGEGAVRRLAAGHAFRLAQHERYPEGDNAFKVLWVEHEARNNFQPALAGAQSRIEPGTYRNRFACVRDVVPLVPAATALPHPHTALGPQTALVVGVPGETATTTRDHQVRVQFAWQRGAGANPGGLGHDVDEQGSAPGDERSGTWVRVAEALAGPNWGTQFTPRIGTEVLVDFIDNDIDRPVVVAQLYSGANAPPFAAGVDSGVNHAGTISGIHTQGFDGGGFNQWQLDDTQGQLRMRLATSSAASQLNLGYLVAQSPGSAHRGSYRGSGFELRTDAWAVVRGGEGVLVTTAARPGGISGVTSTQMDAMEAVSSLKAAQELDTALLDAAKAQKALVSDAPVQAQKDLLAQLDPQDKGKYDGAVNGQEALKAQAGSRALDSAAPVEKFGSPLVVMDAASTINWATSASTVLFAGEQLQWTSQSDLHMAAGHTVSSVSAEATGLYSHEGGVQAFAGNGPVSLQAHTDQLEILADKEVTVISVNDSIEIKASKKIVLQAGQSAITLEGGDITFACPGNFTVKGGKHVFDGGASKAAVVVQLPDSRLKLFDEAFQVVHQTTSEPLAHQPYRIKRADGSYETGLTDDYGMTHVVAGSAAETLSIELLEDMTSSAAVRGRPTGTVNRFKTAGVSNTSPIENKQRKEVQVDQAVCWLKDYEKEISVSSVPRYNNTYDPSKKPRNYFDTVAYKLFVPAKSANSVMVELRIKAIYVKDAITELSEKLDPDGALTKQRAAERAVAVKKAQSTAVKGLESHWNNRFRISITDPKCGTRILPITYKVIWVDSGEHYVMNIHKTYDREGVTDNVIDVSVTTDEWTYAHEFAHCVGLPDEYSYVNVKGETVRYRKPDGKEDVPIDAPFDGKDASAPDATIMSAECTIVKPRHAWQIAIEVQELLTKEVGRKIKCDIIQVR